MRGRGRSAESPTTGSLSVSAPPPPAHGLLRVLEDPPRPQGAGKVARTMPSVRIEDDAFGDPRFQILGINMGLPVAFAEDWARGAMARVWRHCTMRQTHVVSREVLCAIVREEKFADAVIASDLGEPSGDGIRIKGTRGRIEWLRKLKRNAQKGADARWHTKRHPKGNGTGMSDPMPDACPLTLTLTPALTKKDQKQLLDFEALYALYPLKKGRTKGLAIAARQVKTPEQYEKLRTAIVAYAEEVRRLGTEPKYVKHFSTFMGCWEDYTPSGNPVGATARLPGELPDLSPDEVRAEWARQRQEAEREAAQ